MERKKKLIMLLSLMLACATSISADDGSGLWLGSADHGDMAEVSVTTRVIPETALPAAEHATLMLAVQEMRDHWMGYPVTLTYHAGDGMGEGAFRIEKSEATDTDFQFVVTASSASGLLYGAYFMLRAQARHDGCLCTTLPPSHAVEQRPHFRRRWITGQDEVLDMLKKGSVSEYARANASIGINGIVLTVPRHPSRQYEEKVRQLTEQLRPYCITVCLSEDSLSAFTYLSDKSADGNNSIDGLYTYHAPAWRRMMLESGRQDIAADVAVSSRPSWSADDNHLEQANWFAFGRLAWDPALHPEQVAHEWLADTFSENPLFILPLRQAIIACDGSDIQSVETLLDTWRESAFAIDARRHTEVENALNTQIEQGELQSYGE